MTSNPYETERGNERNIDHQLVREEVDRILRSAIFAQSDRLARFLRFTVDSSLAGNGAALKEYLIGTEVYDRKPPYHPSVDSIVRSEARRLRNKLRQYYESIGKDDPVFIYYRTGSYAPEFRSRPAVNRMQFTAQRTLNEILTESLISQTIDLSAGDRHADRQFDVQIIFEGTVRIVRTETAVAAPASLSAKKDMFGRNSSPSVVSILATKPSQLVPTRKVRAEGEPAPLAADLTNVTVTTINATA
jgi:hypothetical protein